LVIVPAIPVEPGVAERVPWVCGSRGAGATSDSDADWNAPLYVAVITAIWRPVIDPAVAVKLADVEPGATVTLPGTLNASTLRNSDTVAPPAPAAAVRLTVQAELPPGERLVCEHPTELTRTCAGRDSDVVCELPFKLAVTTAV